MSTTRNTRSPAHPAPRWRCRVAADDHNFPAVAVDGPGKIHVWANMHTDPMRTVKTTAAHTTDGWLATAGWASATADLPSTDPAAPTPSPSPRRRRPLLLHAATAPHRPAVRRLRRPLLRPAAPPAPPGPAAPPCSKALASPTPAAPVSPATDVTVDSDQLVAYTPVPVVESDRGPHPGRLHISWVWRPDSPGLDVPNVGLSYAYSDDHAATWKAIDGTALTLPFTPLNNLAARLPGHRPHHHPLPHHQRRHRHPRHRLPRLAIGDPITASSKSSPTPPGRPVHCHRRRRRQPHLGPNRRQRIHHRRHGHPRPISRTASRIAIDDNGRPHIICSPAPTWYLRHDGTRWIPTTESPNPSTGGPAPEPLSAFWLRGNLWLLKARPSTPVSAVPRIVELTGPATVMVAMGGDVDPSGDWEPCYDREAYRRFGTVEVLTPDGDTPRVVHVRARRRPASRLDRWRSPTSPPPPATSHPPPSSPRSRRDRHQRPVGHGGRNRQRTHHDLRRGRRHVDSGHRFPPRGRCRRLHHLHGCQVCWSKYNGTQTAPTLADTGDHAAARIYAFRGVHTTTPIDASSGAVGATSTAVSTPSVVTTVADAWVLHAVCLMDDAMDFGATWTNANLAGITVRNASYSWTTGNDGRLVLVTAPKSPPARSVPRPTPSPPPPSKPT